MKSLPKYCASACLTLALAFSAIAGEIGCPYVPPPPPPPDPYATSLNLSEVTVEDALELFTYVFSLV